MDRSGAEHAGAGDQSVVAAGDPRRPGLARRALAAAPRDPLARLRQLPHHSTAARYVWRVQYFNNMQTLILNTIEVSGCPRSRWPHTRTSPIATRLADWWRGWATRCGGLRRARQHADPARRGRDPPAPGWNARSAGRSTTRRRATRSGRSRPARRSPMPAHWTCPNCAAEKRLPGPRWLKPAAAAAALAGRRAGGRVSNASSSGTMQDVPMLNPALPSRRWLSALGGALAGRPGHALVHEPGAAAARAAAWQPIAAGASRTTLFPAGVFEFIGGRDADARRLPGLLAVLADVRVRRPAGRARHRGRRAGGAVRPEALRDGRGAHRVQPPARRRRRTC